MPTPGSPRELFLLLVFDAGEHDVSFYQPCETVSETAFASLLDCTTFFMSTGRNREVYMKDELLETWLVCNRDICVRRGAQRLREIELMFADKPNVTIPSRSGS